MRLPTLTSLPNEPALEKWARYFRFRQLDPIIGNLFLTSKTITLVDFGCGQDILLLRYLQQQFNKNCEQLRYIGIDPLLPANLKTEKHVSLIRSKFETLKLGKVADLVTMFAVIEHVDDAKALIQTAAEVLRPNGVMLITTPTPLARLLLEFLSYQLNLISKREIDEHKRYPTKNSLLSYVTDLKLDGFDMTAEHHYFELGLNNVLIIRMQKQKAS